jgi:hypothetical protein
MLLSLLIPFPLTRRVTLIPNALFIKAEWNDNALVDQFNFLFFSLAKALRIVVLVK